MPLLVCFFVCFCVSQTVSSQLRLQQYVCLSAATLPTLLVLDPDPSGTVSPSKCFLLKAAWVIVFYHSNWKVTKTEGACMLFKPIVMCGHSNTWLLFGFREKAYGILKNKDCLEWKRLSRDTEMKLKHLTSEPRKWVVTLNEGHLQKSHRFETGSAGIPSQLDQ